jgi:hypothetical protein
MSETVDYKAATISGAIFSGSGAGLVTPSSFQSNVQTFDGSGTTATTGNWTKPIAGSQVLIECWGGGGASTGGGGGYSLNIVPFSSITTNPVPYSIAGGGLHPAGPGGNTIFGPYAGPATSTSNVTAYGGGGNTGGGGGLSSVGVTGPAGAGGGPAVPSTSNPNSLTGGSGSAATATRGLFYGGGGGGTTTGGSSVYGGGGGSGTTAGTSVYGGSGGIGANAGAPSGGGGGPTGNGGAGRVRVTVF